MRGADCVRLTSCDPPLSQPFEDAVTYDCVARAISQRRGHERRFRLPETDDVLLDHEGERHISDPSAPFRHDNFYATTPAPARAFPIACDASSYRPLDRRSLHRIVRVSNRVSYRPNTA